LLHEVYVLFHGFCNVGNFTIFKGMLRVLRRVASGVDVPVINPRAVLNICWMLLYNTSIFRVGRI
jgi:polysaccharide pyruvyl transferase WcaK-like protein